MSPSDKAAYLSKSLYTRGLQCHKSLYLHRYRPELRGEPTSELEALWKSGHEVGDIAHMLFPGGVIVPFDGLTKDEQLAKTREEIDRGTKAIHEATFFYNDVFVNPGNQRATCRGREYIQRLQKGGGVSRNG